MSKFDINNYAWKPQDNISWKQNYDGMLSTYNNLVTAYHNKQVDYIKLQEAFSKMEYERNDFRNAYELEQTLHQKHLDAYHKLAWELRDEQEKRNQDALIKEQLAKEISNLHITIQEMHKGWNETKKARDDWQLNYNIVLKEKNEVLDKYWAAQQLIDVLKLRRS